jgi:Tannase and feruloyl esterase
MSCEQVSAFRLPGVTISSSASVPTGAWTLPNAAAGAAPVQVPAFCRVAAVAWPEVRFELWLPEHWNGKFMGVGNGGLAGTISYAAMLPPLRRGYAVASTDTGHQGNSNDASWAAGHMERVVDFAYRGIHATAQAAKVITRSYYDGSIAHSYFEGCSQGGQQALMLAQRFPNDFDGIIAGDPANYWTHHYIGGHLWTALAMDGPGFIPPAKLPVIGAAVMAACDALDGVKDGVLSDPRRCRFDPSTIACKGADGPDCLTAPQVDALQKLYTGLRDASGKQLYPGLLPGGEDIPGGWASWVTGASPGQSQHARLGIPFMKYIAFEEPDWDFHTFRFTRSDGLDNDIEFTDAKLGGLFNAIDPDLWGFRENGGKLIQYHGWADPDITPLNSIDYYESVVNLSGLGTAEALRETQQFYRLFMVPGMQHCRGGAGTDSFQMLDALEGWVENGIAPDRVVASHLTNGKVDRTRPLCPYPAEAKWNGSGSTDDAANFTCAVPAAQ